MEESILRTIKKMLGIHYDNTDFDLDIIVHINSVFLTLQQLGVGPPTGFFVQDDTAIWFNYIGDESAIQAVKSYIYLKVRMIFDPPVNANLTAAFERQIAELEWRLNHQVDIPPVVPEVVIIDD